MASVYQKRGRGTWYLRVKGAAGRWADIASTAKTKTEARRLAADLERKAERQRLGLDPLPTDCTLTVGQLVEWWLQERCPQASYGREESRLRKNIISTSLGAVPVRHLTAARVEDHADCIAAQERRSRRHDHVLQLPAGRYVNIHPRTDRSPGNGPYTTRPAGQPGRDLSHHLDPVPGQRHQPAFP